MGYICTKCGLQNNPGDKFCSECGNPLQSSEKKVGKLVLPTTDKDEVATQSEEIVVQNQPEAATPIHTEQTVTSSVTPDNSKKKGILKTILIGIAIFLIGAIGYHLMGFGDANYNSTVQTMSLTKNEILGDRVNSALLIEGGKSAKLENIKWEIIKENNKGKVVQAKMDKKLYVEIQTYEKGDVVYVDRGDIVLHNDNDNRTSTRVLF